MILRIRVPIADLNAALAELGDVNAKKAIKRILVRAAGILRGIARAGARGRRSTGNLARAINTFASRSNVTPSAYVRVAAKTRGTGGSAIAPYAFPVEGGSVKFQGKRFIERAAEDGQAAIDQATEEIKRLIESKWGRL